MTLHTVVEKDKAGDIMTKEVYNVVADEKELKWFFDHVIQKPKVNESYSMVFVCRHKKLTKEEQATLGMASNETEFLATQTLRLAKFHSASVIDNATNWTFFKFLQHVRRFEVNKEAYLTTEGQPLPDKALVTIFYVNPCDDIKVARQLIHKLDDTGDAIIKAMLNGKSLEDNLQSYQTYGNIESAVKHLKANCKGSNYWMDFDLDVPAWFKEKYFSFLTETFNKFYGKGNYVVVETSGGYHILVKSCKNKMNPHDVCKEFQAFYNAKVAEGEEPYVDEKGVVKFECILNDSQIPGLPLPGTYQYGKCVRVLNKEDFVDECLERKKKNEKNK